MIKAARMLAAGAAVAALALTGCAQNPSSAGTVGGVPIADSTVRGAAQAMAEASGTETSVTMKQAMFDFMLGEASRQIAAATGTPVAQADKDKVLSNSQLAVAMSATPDGEAWGDAVGTSYVVLDKLGQERYLEELNKVSIELNPRYGDWDATNLEIADASLSRPADPASRRR